MVTLIFVLGYIFWNKQAPSGCFVAEQVKCQVLALRRVPAVVLQPAEQSTQVPVKAAALSVGERPGTSISLNDCEHITKKTTQPARYCQS